MSRENTNPTAQRVIDVANALGRARQCEGRIGGAELAAVMNLTRVLKVANASHDEDGYFYLNDTVKP